MTKSQKKKDLGKTKIFAAIGAPKGGGPIREEIIDRAALGPSELFGAFGAFRGLGSFWRLFPALFGFPVPFFPFFRSF